MADESKISWHEKILTIDDCVHIQAKYLNSIELYDKKIRDVFGFHVLITLVIAIIIRVLIIVYPIIFDVDVLVSALFLPVLGSIYYMSYIIEKRSSARLKYATYVLNYLEEDRIDMSETNGQSHIKCKKCGYIFIPKEDEVDKLVTLATIGLPRGAMQDIVKCDDCKEKGHLVAIGEDGEEIGPWHSKEE